MQLEEMSQFLGNHEMFLILMQIRIFAILPQLNALPAIGLLKTGEANTRDVIGFRGQEPLQRFRESVCEHLDRGGGHLFTSMTFESIFQIVLTGALDTFVLVLRIHCQVGLALFEPCLSRFLVRQCTHLYACALAQLA